MINKQILILFYRNSQTFDEDDILNGTPKSSLANLPDEATGAPQLERSTEIATAQTFPSNSVVRNLKSHPFVTCSFSYFEEKTTEIRHIMTIPLALICFCRF